MFNGIKHKNHAKMMWCYCSVLNNLSSDQVQQLSDCWDGRPWL